MTSAAEKTSYADTVAEFGTTTRSWDDPQHPMNVLMRAGTAALDDVIAGCRSPDRNVRKYCLGILDHFADDRCEEVIVRGLKDRYPDVRRWAAHAISCQQCKPRPLGIDIAALLIDLVLNDRSIAVRRVAACYLSGHAHDARARAALERVVATETDAKLLSRARYALTVRPSESCPRG
jgi:hypothetical protein